MFHGELQTPAGEVQRLCYGQPRFEMNILNRAAGRRVRIPTEPEPLYLEFVPLGL